MNCLKKIRFHINFFKAVPCRPEILKNQDSKDCMRPSLVFQESHFYEFELLSICVIVAKYKLTLLRRIGGQNIAKIKFKWIKSHVNNYLGGPCITVIQSRHKHSPMSQILGNVSC